MGVVYRAKTGKIIFHGDVHIEPLSWGRGDPDSNTLKIKIQIIIYPQLVQL